MKSTPGFLRNGWKLLQSLIIAHQTEIDKIQKLKKLRLIFAKMNSG